MGLVKDDLGIEVEESILARVKDPKFTETEALLNYRDARIAKQRELDTEKKRKEEAEANPPKMFGIF